MIVLGPQPAGETFPNSKRRAEGKILRISVGENMKKAFLSVLVSCVLVATSFGQASNATLTGTVADATGAVLPGVSITATNNATGVVSTIVSNEAGAYTIPSLVPGTYTVSAELPGFQKQNYTNTVLGNGVSVRLNF